MDDRVQFEVEKNEDWDPFGHTGALTQKQANEFIRNGGIRCPYCGSEEIHTGCQSTEAGSCFIEMECSICNHEWVEGYRLVEIYDEDNTHFEYMDEFTPLEIEHADKG